MGHFEIRNDKLYLNGDEFRLIGGALHYFRVPRAYWRDRLEKLLMMGCNTVETIVPWNIHEPSPGVFDFQGDRDVAAFTRTAGTGDSGASASFALHLRGMGVRGTALVAAQRPLDAGAQLLSGVYGRGFPVLR